MKYIAHKRFKGKALSGDMNIPAMAELNEEKGMLTYGGKEVCCSTSENAHRYFARNDDGRGMVRGALTRAVIKRLAKRDSHYQQRWDRVWGDQICRRYKRDAHGSHWLWSHQFYLADIDTLRHIAKLIGAREGK